MGIVKTSPFLLIACTDTKISLNSVSKQPEFILIPPPIVPGIHDKNSNPLKLFSIAKSDNDLSKTLLPAIIVFSFNNEVLEKFLLNLITAPSNKPSLNKIFDPAPNINRFLLLESQNGNTLQTNSLNTDIQDLLSEQNINDLLNDITSESGKSI